MYFNLMKTVASMLLLAYLARCQGQQGKQVIHLLSVLPYYHPDPSLNPSWSQGQNIQPALELAKDQINNSSALLSDYHLNLIYAIGGCDIRPITTVSLVMEILAATRGNLTGIVGPGCTVSTIEASSLTNRSALRLVTVHGAGSPAFSDRMKYPYILGALGSSNVFVDRLLYLIDMAQWSRVAVMYDDSRDFYLHIKRNLVQNRTEVKLAAPVSPTFIPLPAFEQSLLRVVIVLCPEALSRMIICLAHVKSLVYNSYQWVFVGHRIETLTSPIDVVYEGKSYSCTSADMAATLEMSILLTYNFTPKDDSKLFANITHQEYLQRYAVYRDMYNQETAPAKNSTYTYWASYLYDSVWAWAIVLDNLTKTQDNFEVGTSYGNLEQSQMIVEQFYRTSFQGVSGRINFDRETGYTNRTVDACQIRDGNCSGDMKELIFIPDSFPSAVRESHAIGAVALVTFIIQLLVIVVTHSLTIAYRKQPSIKASSSVLLYLSYIGAYIIVLSTLVYFIFIAARLPLKMRHYFCQTLWGFSLPIGFILSIAPVAMRTWRVYRIFKHYLNPGPLISDPILISSVFVLLLPVIAISIAWAVIDPFEVTKVYDRRIPGRMIRAKKVCDCTHYYLWLSINLTYLTGVLLLMIILSLMTRNIANKSFATTALRVFAYAMTAAFLIGFPFFYLIQSVNFNPDYSFSVLVIHLNFMMGVFTACVFIPPVLPIFQRFRHRIRKISVMSNSSGVELVSQYRRPS